MVRIASFKSQSPWPESSIVFQKPNKHSMISLASKQIWVYLSSWRLISDWVGCVIGECLGHRSMLCAQSSLVTFWTCVQDFNHNYSMQLIYHSSYCFDRDYNPPGDQVHDWFCIGFYNKPKGKGGQINRQQTFLYLFSMEKQHSVELAFSDYQSEQTNNTSLT